jgi:hypothetical protein
MTTAVGVFDHYGNAEWAVEVLHSYGIPRDLISMATSDMKLVKTRISGNTAGEPHMLLAGIRATVFTAPEVGQLIAAGPLADTWLTSLGNNMAGGLLEVLLYAGVSARDAIFYEDSVKDGNILVLLDADPQNERRIRAILLGAGATNKTDHGQLWQSKAGAALDNIESAAR